MSFAPVHRKFQVSENYRVPVSLSFCYLDFHHHENHCLGEAALVEIRGCWISTSEDPLGEI